MHRIRRIASILVMCSLVLSMVPSAPAAAMSTEKEIQLGQTLDQEIDSQSVISDDPFLTNWVTTIGDKLATHRERTAITYHFEIIDSNEVNSFAIPGGFVHVDMGLLNFVTSDDELAGVIGHEMGHIERGHVTSLNDKGNILSVLIGVLSILNPIGYLLGGTAGDLVYEKFSRIDELQADQYGLLLMTESGYDPRSAVDTFIHLDQLDPGGGGDKYFADHPAPLDRVSHMLGYPELSQATANTVTAAAIHDETEGRYTYANDRFQQALAKDPSDALATSNISALKVATTEPASGDVADRGASADAFGSDASSVADAARSLVAADNVAHDDVAVAADQAHTGGQEIENYVDQLESLSDAAPNLANPTKKGNNLSQASDGVNRLARDINGTIDLASDVMGTAPGLIDDDRTTIKMLEAPLSSGPLTAKSQALLAWYPSMTAGLRQSADDYVDAIDRGRAAISTSEGSIKLAETFFSDLDKLDDTKGDIPDKTWAPIKTDMDAAIASWDASFQASLECENEMYAAQTRSLSAQITMQDLESSPARYAAFARALAYRFPGVTVPDYSAALSSGVAPGEIAAAAWYAYETKKPLSPILSEERSDGTDVIQLQRHDDLFSESMEIAEGLILQDYTETLPPLPKA